MTNIIEINNMEKSYYPSRSVRVPALTGLSLCVREGEMIAIYGVSGSGKSTLLHILGGLDRPDSGEYILDGEVMGEKNDSQLARVRNEKIGFVLQDFGLIANRTAQDNVIVPVIFSNKSLREGYKRCKILLDKLGIPELERRKVSQMSGGQKQRVAIARALMNEPKILLADEPSGALDSTTKEEIYAMFDMLRKEGKTIIIATHDQSIAQIADRVLQMKDGQLSEC
ncbi:MAG TPA: ABC transporter ATP-binding protein [Clostridiaceae bacterium]|nr:ABC transporter ATP-binding protein [Clostridiaceae bacterium]